MTTAGTAPEGVTIPDTAAGLEEMLNDPKQMKALFAEQGKFGDFIRAYAKTVLQKDQEIATQVRDQVERTLAGWLKDQRADGEGVAPVNMAHTTADGVARTAQARAGLHNPKAMGAALDREFKDSGEYFQAIWHNAQHDAQSQARMSRVRNAFSSNVPSEGGFLIPETLRSELLRVSLEQSIVRPRARVVPMESLRVPFPAIDSTSNVSSVYGGIVGYWTEEGAALTASSASFGRIVLDAKKLTAYTEVPNELISDSISSFQMFIDQLFPEALGFYEDDAFINGSGVGEPLGFLDAPAMISVTRAASGNAVDFADVVGIYCRMLPSSLMRAVWIISPAVLSSLFKLVLATGGTGNETVAPPLWLNNQSAIGGPTMTLLGRPVIVSEKVPNATSAGDISFVDLGFYLVGDRQAMSATSSPHFKFQNDVTAYRIIERVDGRPWLNSAITPKNNGDTLSPFVKLAA
jgi:HK97 family phage major capsid protein